MPKSFQPRVAALDALRVAAIFGVILIHTTTKTLEVTSYDVQRTQISLFLNIFARFAVPLFFLISGFVLEYRYREDFVLHHYFKRRTVRILVPYLFWSFLYFVFHTILLHKSFDFILFIYQILVGEAEYHLYFIPTIILFYLLYPFLHRYKDIVFQKKTMIVLAILEIGLVMYDYYFQEINIVYPLRVLLLNYFFFVFGMWISHHIDRIRNYLSRRTAMFGILTVSAVLAAYFETRRLFLLSRDLSYIYSQWRILIYLYVLLLAGFLFPIFEKASYLTKPIHLLSRLSFFIFFIHIFILYAFWHFVGVPLFYKTAGHMADSGLYDIFFFLSVATVSAVIAFIASKIPKIGLMVGI